MGTPFPFLALLLPSIFLGAAGHPTDFPEDRHDPQQENSWSLDDLNDGNEHDARRDEALEKLQQVGVTLCLFAVKSSEDSERWRDANRRGSPVKRSRSLQVLGIRSHSEKLGRHKVPPQFMVELYNNVADPSGITRRKNPYNAKVVRSFIERGKVVAFVVRRSFQKLLLSCRSFCTDTSMSRFYFFNITGLEINESVLEAELHLYRKRMLLKTIRPSTLASPYYLVSFSYLRI